MAKGHKESPKFKNYVRRQPDDDVVKTSSDDYLLYGYYDNFPLKLSQLVYDSPAASSCISVISDFIEGDGFSSEDVANKVVNAQGETLAQIHHPTSESLAMYEGFTWNIKYNGEGKITEIYFVPFENCRLGKPDSKGIISEIKYNPYFGVGSKYNPKNTETFDAFNPDPVVVMQQIANKGKKYKGQILYWGSTRALSRFYPQPSYYSAKNWMEVDARIGEYHVNNLRNGFLQSVILKMIGDPNQPSTNPKDSTFDSTNQKQEPIKTQGEALDEAMSAKFSGTERVGNVMVMWANNKEEFPTIEAFPTGANTQLLDTLQSLTTKNITIATKVPAILANIHEGVSLGGDGNTIEAAVKLMQQRAAKWQAILEQNYTKVLTNFVEPVLTDIEIVDHNPFPTSKTVDPLIWGSLNQETKDNWIQKNTGFEIKKPLQSNDNLNQPAQDEETLKAQAALRGSVGGVTGVLSIQQGVVDGTTTIGSALAILTIIYGFTRNEALRLLGQPEESQTTQAPVNVLYNSYPEGARKSALKALQWHENNGQCGSKMGWDIAKEISDGKPITYKTIKRIKNYLIKNEEHMNKPFNESCNTVLFHAWGGKDMLEWTKNKVNEVEL